MIDMDRGKAILRARKVLKRVGYDTSQMTDHEVEEMFRKVGDTVTEKAKDLKKKAQNFLGDFFKKE